VSVQTFLRQRAVNVTVGGSYSLANWYDQNGKLRNFACRTSRVSPFRMIVDVPVVGRVGDSISSYFSDFGELDGHISDTVPGGFLFELAVTRAMRERLSNQLSWLEKRLSDLAIQDAREIGTPLAVGGCVGRVIRHRDDGFAVKFTELQNRGELEWRIARPPTRNSTTEARVERLATATPPTPEPQTAQANTCDRDGIDTVILDT
jgi:hypothetical protein